MPKSTATFIDLDIADPTRIVAPPQGPLLPFGKLGSFDEFGVMAGMRAALARVLLRFDPVQLEERLTDKSLVDSLLPANRKAKLWGQYLALYTDITREAEDDFQTWFGREFLNAYEAQMAKLKQDSQQ